MTKTIAIVGGAFNPPAVNHREIVCLASQHFDQVVVIPCGLRPDKPELAEVAPAKRAYMCALAFAGIPNMVLNFSDLVRGHYTITHEVQSTYTNLGEIWHVFGGDIFMPREHGMPAILTWEHGREMWETFNFAVMVCYRPEEIPDVLPPRHRLFRVRTCIHSSEIRRRIREGESIAGLVEPLVADYISRNDLYRNPAK